MPLDCLAFMDEIEQIVQSDANGQNALFSRLINRYKITESDQLSQNQQAEYVQLISSTADAYLEHPIDEKNQKHKFYHAVWAFKLLNTISTTFIRDNLLKLINNPEVISRLRNKDEKLKNAIIGLFSFEDALLIAELTDDIKNEWKALKANSADERLLLQWLEKVVVLGQILSGVTKYDAAKVEDLINCIIKANTQAEKDERVDALVRTLQLEEVKKLLDDIKKRLADNKLALAYFFLVFGKVMNAATPENRIGIAQAFAQADFYFRPHYQKAGANIEKVLRDINQKMSQKTMVPSEINIPWDELFHALRACTHGVKEWVKHREKSPELKGNLETFDECANEIFGLKSDWVNYKNQPIGLGLNQNQDNASINFNQISETLIEKLKCFLETLGKIELYIKNRLVSGENSQRFLSKTLPPVVAGASAQSSSSAAAVCSASQNNGP